MEISIKAKNLNRVLKDVEDRTQAIKDKTTEMVRQTTELGEKEASANFSRADYDGTNDVRVTSRVYKKTGTVTAKGTKTLFIEFGTGIIFPNDHPEATGLNVEHGSWSEGPEGKGHWDDINGWFFKHGQHSYGNPANRCMYNAKKEVERNAQKIARRVFK